MLVSRRWILIPTKQCFPQSSRITYDELLWPILSSRETTFRMIELSDLMYHLPMTRRSFILKLRYDELQLRNEIVHYVSSDAKLLLHKTSYWHYLTCVMTSEVCSYLLSEWICLVTDHVLMLIIESSLFRSSMQIAINITATIDIKL